jgi:hypothetical protein
VKPRPVRHRPDLDQIQREPRSRQRSTTRGFSAKLQKGTSSRTILRPVRFHSERRRAKRSRKSAVVVATLFLFGFGYATPGSLRDTCSLS